MRELDTHEVDSVSGGDMRSVAVGAGRVVGAGAGYAACFACGGTLRTVAAVAGSELGGGAAGYAYDNPAQTLGGAAHTLVVADALSSFSDTLDPVWGGGEGGTAADPTSW